MASSHRSFKRQHFDKDEIALILDSGLDATEENSSETDEEDDMIEQAPVLPRQVYKRNTVMDQLAGDVHDNTNDNSDDEVHGCKLYMDNFFLLPNLFDHLTKQKINCSGTVRLNRKDTPQNLPSQNKRLKPGDIHSRTRDDLMAIVCRDKHDVYILTNMHNPPEPSSLFHFWIFGAPPCTKLSRCSRIISFPPCSLVTLDCVINVTCLPLPPSFLISLRLSKPVFSYAGDQCSEWTFPPLQKSCFVHLYLFFFLNSVSAW
jgi:hypothetical protein